MKNNGKAWLQHKPNIITERDQYKIKTKGKPIACNNCNKKQKL